jgi:hypothetical protein
VVDRLYRESVQEFKIRSALFGSREDAVAFATAMKAGTGFEKAFEPFVDSGRVSAHEGQFVRSGEMRPEVAAVLRELAPGEVSGPVDVHGGVAVIQLLDVRVPDIPEERAVAEETALAYRKQEELQSYTNELRDRYAKVDEELLESLDLGSTEAGIDAFRNDERIVAEVKDAEPVTVKELTLRVEQTLYHGMDRAAKRGRLNDKLPSVLQRIVLERVMELEAKRLNLEERPDFKSARAAQVESVLFGSFVRRVVNPEIEVSDEEIEAFYNEHIDAYMTSAMIRLDGLPFGDREHAEAGLAKLRQGSDLNWMRAHADGLVDVSDDVDGLMKFSGRVLAVEMLPEGVKKVVEGTSAGDLRFYADPGGVYYVLVVQEVYPSRPQAFADTRDQILQRIFIQKREEAMAEWTARLREASEIEIHANEEQIRTVLGLGPAGTR